nr:hypothetical protein [Tanacetum cinerariifolium]
PSSGLPTSSSSEDFHESSSSESSEDTDSRGADSAVVVGVGVGRVVEEVESSFFFLALAFGLDAASPIAHA